MKKQWQRLAARIDEMSLRQRAMLFATAGLVVVVFAHVALIEPLLLRQKSLIDRGNRDQTQLTAVRAQIEGLLREQQTPKDPSQLAVLELEAAGRAGASSRQSQERLRRAEPAARFAAPPARFRAGGDVGIAADPAGCACPGWRPRSPRPRDDAPWQLSRSHAVPDGYGEDAGATALGPGRAPGREVPGRSA